VLSLTPYFSTSLFFYFSDRYIIESIPSTIIVLDRSLKILYANRNYYAKSGKKERDEVGERLERVFSPMLIEKTHIDEKIRQVFETGIPFNGDQLNRGSTFYFTLPKGE
jgi:PAS domain-containing protein